jgi:sugar/nucleoside kinase (ribokinase family)
MSRRAFDVIGMGYCSDDYLGVTPQLAAFDGDTVSMTAFARDGGGPVSTALATLTRLGASASYLGVLGDDESGQFLFDLFVQTNVDVAHVRRQAGGRTPVCMVMVEQDTGRRSIHCYRGTLRDYELTDASRADLRRARFLHIDGHSIGAVEEAARLVHDAGGQVVFDANRPRPQVERFLACTDVLIAASTFPSALTGIQDLEEASRRLLVSGPRLVVTTLGRRGCFVLSPVETFYAPGFAVDVVDTTGAGDAFHGGFIYGLLHHWPLGETARFANAVAALNCRQLGGRRGLPRLAEVEALLSTPPAGF